MLPPPYHQVVWNYEKADPYNIRKALDFVNWERLFDQKSIDAQVATFNDTILNTLRNFVPNNYVTIDDKYPVWMNEHLQILLHIFRTPFPRNTSWWLLLYN